MAKIYIEGKIKLKKEYYLLKLYTDRFTFPKLDFPLLRDVYYNNKRIEQIPIEKGIGILMFIPNLKRANYKCIVERKYTIISIKVGKDEDLMPEVKNFISSPIIYDADFNKKDDEIISSILNRAYKNWTQIPDKIKFFEPTLVTLLKVRSLLIDNGIIIKEPKFF